MRPLSGIFNISGVCILSTHNRMWRMLIRHRRTRVSESKQTTICENRGKWSHSLPDLYLALQLKFLLCVCCIFRHCAEEFYYHRDCDGGSNCVGDGLGHLDAKKAYCLAEDPQNRDKDQSAADHGEKRSFSALSDTLEHHISTQGEGHTEQGEALDAQSSDADTDNGRVIPEHTHDGSREYDTDQC